MGRAYRWFRGLIGFNKPDPDDKPPKKKWTLVRSYKDKDHSLMLTPEKSQHGVVPLHPSGETEGDAGNHAITMAEATAAVAEAAVAAAQAAAAVVRLTSNGRTTDSAVNGCVDMSARVSQMAAGYGCREDLAAVMIQSHFRAYLVRPSISFSLPSPNIFELKYTLIYIVLLYLYLYFVDHISYLFLSLGQ